MFIGRETELKLIQECLQKKSASILIYGKRKVGKTTLITHALKNHPDKFIYFECLKTSMQDNINNFVNMLVQAKVLPIASIYSSFIDVFSYLNSIPETFNIVFDEYPYLKKHNDAQTVDSVFQNIIDNHISNIRLFISGSHIGMMKDLLAEGNALYCRFNPILHLEELNYKQISSFYPDKTHYDKVAFYSVFGGSPFVNELINPSLSLKENIINTILNPKNAVFTYADNLLLSDLFSNSNIERILFAISNGQKKYSEIQNKLQMSGNGLLNKQMKHLLAMEIVSKVAPINKLTDNKKIRYEITDNLLRFYYTYIYSNKSILHVLGAETFYEEFIAPSITTFISHRFEEICRKYFSLQAQSCKLSGVLNIGTYYYDDFKTKTNGEFDIALQKRNNKYDIYEAKFLSSPMSEKQMQIEVEQIKNIKGLSVDSIGFISINGFENSSLPYNCISGIDLYQ